jgi:IS30 family transposase
LYEKKKLFSHLSKSERHEIAILRKKKYSFRDIAKALCRSVSSICDEWQRGRVRRKYDPEKAHHKAYVRRRASKYQAMKVVEHAALRDFIEASLCDGQSPGNIAGRIRKREKHLPSIGKDAIYTFIGSVYGRKIESFRNKRNQRRKGRGKKLVQLQDRVFIDKRPMHINDRKRLGDAEADFIVSGKGGKGILLTLADRKTRVSFIEQILDVSIAHVERAFLRIKQRFPELTTFTTDNDILLRHHKRLEKMLGIKIYFCNPYHSWEKGTIENTNKHIRKDILKGSDISKYSKRFIQKIEAKLNRRFMEVTDHETPAEALARFRKRKKRQRAQG